MTKILSEAGRPDYEVAVRLLKLYDKPVEELFGWCKIETFQGR